MIGPTNHNFYNIYKGEVNDIIYLPSFIQHDLHTNMALTAIKDKTENDENDKRQFRYTEIQHQHLLHSTSLH